MKKIAKLALSLAMMASVAAVGTTALAAGDGTITVTDCKAFHLTFTVDGRTADTQKTMAIIKGDTNTVIQENNVNDVVALDQSETQFTAVDLKQLASPAGTYVLRVGGDTAAGYAETTFTIDADGNLVTSTGETVLMGDVNYDGSADGADGTVILRADLDLAAKLTGKDLFVADVNADGSADGTDVTDILRADLSLTHTGSAGSQGTYNP